MSISSRVQQIGIPSAARELKGLRARIAAQQKLALISGEPSNRTTKSLNQHWPENENSKRSLRDTDCRFVMGAGRFGTWHRAAIRGCERDSLFLSTFSGVLCDDTRCHRDVDFSLFCNDPR